MKPLIFFLAFVMLIFPVVMVVRIWHTRTMGTLLAAGTVLAHLMIVFASFFAGWFLATAAYLVIVNLLWISTFFWGSNLEDHRRMKMLETDIDKYERIIRARPEHAAAHSALGEAYATQGRIDEAIAVLDKAIALDPDNSRQDRWRRQQLIIIQRNRDQAQKKSPDA